MSAYPLISAILTTHNRQHLLPRALDSILNQTYPNIEVVVVDDASDYSAEKIIHKYQNKIQVKFFRNSVSKGACAARNKGIELAAGMFVSGLDDDDEWMPQRLEKLYHAYSDEYAFSTSDIAQVYPNRTLIWRKKPILTLEQLLYSNQVGNQALIKKERMEMIGGFDESLVAAQDYDLWLRLCEKYGDIVNVNEALQKVYFEHSETQISIPKKQLRGYLQFYQKHKPKMNYSQRKYQLFQIRKAIGKVENYSDLLGWVPVHKLWKEIKVLTGKKLL